MTAMLLLLALPAVVAGLRLPIGSLQQATSSTLQHPAWLTNCKAIYLDVGSNIGVQVRKFFEPEKYLGAPAIRAFDTAFGDGPSRRAAAEAGELCALGMEPNPKHQFRLQALENFYVEKGWNVHFYPVAASGTSGKSSFTEYDAKGYIQTKDMGGHLVQSSDEGQSTVATVDLAAFVKELPKGSIRLMKMDVEGAEYEILTKMIQEKVLCQDTVKALNIEAHSFGKGADSWEGERNIDGVEKRLKEQNCQPPQLLKFDDEYYPEDDTSEDMAIAEQRLTEKRASLKAS